MALALARLSHWTTNSTVRIAMIHHPQIDGAMQRTDQTDG